MCLFENQCNACSWHCLRLLTIHRQQHRQQQHRRGKWCWVRSGLSHRRPYQRAACARNFHFALFVGLIIRLIWFKRRIDAIGDDFTKWNNFRCSYIDQQNCFFFHLFWALSGFEKFLFRFVAPTALSFIKHLSRSRVNQREQFDCLSDSSPISITDRTEPNRATW